ncbi:hypothetical protein G3601_004656 [Salmonella enterica]|uniref:Uncharacterized protein n=1 Tax=Salmonella enterica subsp. enterica serovar Java TaxID=224729 RepID=A0A5X0ZCJ0_SALEB|nr:hypothetical protein [Salmonella enterica]EBS3850369.1 hypothetical protein [Salmonella enterica subsp. enterica serovar Java]ECW2977662.1 hypothetical protein [Salmonella enterica subsp. diarizonae]EDQ0182533.1 hypothetical protein [Salmonella enterica subsp. enterica serovar 4,[5],12:b:-]EAO8766892.1 hypothetical protein [Salmonella enterica]
MSFLKVNVWHSGFTATAEDETIVTDIKLAPYVVNEAVKNVAAIFTTWIKQGLPCFFHFSGVQPVSPPYSLCR